MIPPIIEKVWQRLSAMQIAVAMLVAEGLSNRDIGKRLGHDEATIKGAVRVLRYRLDAGNRTQLAMMVWRFTSGGVE